MIARLFAVEDELPAAKPKIRALAATLMPDARAGDFAQAMMDLGATICTPKKPACALCPWMEPCVARERGDQETFPRKTPKARRQAAPRRGLRRARAPTARCWCARGREKGLLGGMTEVPTNGMERTTSTRSDALARCAAAAARRRRNGCAAGRRQRTSSRISRSSSRSILRTVACQDAGARGHALGRARRMPGEALPNVMRKVSRTRDLMSALAVETFRPERRFAPSGDSKCRRLAHIGLPVATLITAPFSRLMR